MAKIHTSLIIRTAAAAIVTAVLAASPPAAAQGGAAQSSASQNDKRAAAFVAQAKAAFAAGDAHDALRSFRDAWALAKTPEIAANLATIESSFGRHRDAAEHFQFALSHLPREATSEQKQAVAAGLDTEKQQVVTLVVRGAPVGARLFIDEQMFGTAPYTDNLYVETGKHEVRAEAPGYPTITQTVTALAVGTTQAVQLAPSQVEAPAPAVHTDPQQPGSVAPPPVIDVGSQRSPVVLIVGGGVALVGAVLGTVFLVKEKTALNDGSEVRAALPGDNACFDPSSHPAQCAALHDANVAVGRDRNIAIASFVVGGAAAVGSLGYWLWPRPPTASGRVGAIIAPHYAAVQAGWTW